jgi:hypothetical protein
MIGAGCTLKSGLGFVAPELQCTQTPQHPRFAHPSLPTSAIHGPRASQRLGFAVKVSLISAAKRPTIRGHELDWRREMESTTGHRREKSHRRSRYSGKARLLAAMAAFAMLATASPAAADEYDENYTGHPLRVLAYVLHPVGVILDTLIFRPFYWIGSHEPFKTLSGRVD